jgi:GT2 family glycosyltransferase
MAPPDVSVVVVSYRRRELLEACLESVEGALERLPGSSELLIVDNGSRDGTVELVRDRWPDAVVLENAENAGFARAVMQGVRATTGRWVLLVNNDVTLEATAPAALLAAGESAPDVGSVAAQLRFADRPGVLNSAGIAVDRLGVAVDRKLGQPVESGEREPVEVFGASGGAALYRRELLDAVGGLDESFFAYLEDADLAWRARMAGWRALYAPGAVAYHHHSATLGHGSAAKLFLVGRNRVRVLAKNATTSHLLRYGAGIAAYDVAYVVFAALRFRSLAPLRGRVSGLRDCGRYRRAGAADRRRVELTPVAGIRAALRRDRAWGR